MLPCMRELMNIKFYKSVDSSVRDYVGNDNLAKALSMHPLLIGGNPYATTSIYLLIQYLEWKWGVYCQRWDKIDNIWAIQFDE